ncbi:MAG: ATPase, T2SS/T4P/T4SS family, partial [Verrucomicrobiota bacterium]
MRRNELDHILGAMLESQKEVSDLNITVDKPLQVETNGQLAAVALSPSIDKLTPFQSEMMALNLIGGNRRLTEDLLRNGSCDSSYSLADKAKFRVNIFSQRGNYSVVLRKLNTQIPTLKDLKLPDIFLQMAKEKTGLILVTGATGSGKSTTLAALLNEINER